MAEAAKDVEKAPAPIARKICGVIMPISAADGCSEENWSDVLDVLSESMENAGFEANIVSHADEVGIIHKRIIQNLYDNEVVVCDVSGKNPNVMFELGLRLAFDKPTIIIKDDKTPYSFDTAAIEHLEYPRDLRYSKIVEFKERLAEKITATHQRATSDPAYTTFLKHFGEFTVAKIEKKEVPSQQFVIEELKNIRQTLAAMDTRPRGRLSRDWEREDYEDTLVFELDGAAESTIQVLDRHLSKYRAVASVEAVRTGKGRPVVVVQLRDASPLIRQRIKQEARNLISERRRKTARPADVTMATTPPQTIVEPVEVLPPEDAAN